MIKKSVEPFPEPGCLSVYVVYEKSCGPVGYKHGNPAVGWGIRVGMNALERASIGPLLFGSAREAKLFAEKLYAIDGWILPGGTQYYAVPAEVKKPKYRTIDAPWF